MGMAKRLLEGYCEAMHPWDFDAQDELFRKVCEGEVTVTLEEMIRVIDNRHNKHCEGKDES